MTEPLQSVIGVTDDVNGTKMMNNDFVHEAIVPNYIVEIRFCCGRRNLDIKRRIVFANRPIIGGWTSVIHSDHCDEDASL